MVNFNKIAAIIFLVLLVISLLGKWANSVILLLIIVAGIYALYELYIFLFGTGEGKDDY